MSKKPSDVKKISVSLNEENFEALKDLEFLAENNGLEVNRSAIINQALSSWFNCSFKYIEKFKDIDGNFVRADVPLNKAITELLKELEKQYGVQKLAVWLNYAIYSKVINGGFPVTIGKVAEVEEFEKSMQKLLEKIQVK